jgi:hypothetical protein
MQSSASVSGLVHAGSDQQIDSQKGGYNGKAALRSMHARLGHAAPLIVRPTKVFLLNEYRKVWGCRTGHRHRCKRRLPYHC